MKHDLALERVTGKPGSRTAVGRHRWWAGARKLPLESRSSHFRAFREWIGLLGLPLQAAGLKRRSSCPHSSGGCKSQTKVSAGLVSPEAALLGVSLCPQVVVPGCVSVLISHKDTSRIGLGPTQVISFNRNRLFNDPLLEQCHSQVSAVEASAYGFGGTQCNAPP